MAKELNIDLFIKKLDKAGYDLQGNRVVPNPISTGALNQEKEVLHEKLATQAKEVVQKQADFAAARGKPGEKAAYDALVAATKEVQKIEAQIEQIDNQASNKPAIDAAAKDIKASIDALSKRGQPLKAITDFIGQPPFVNISGGAQSIDSTKLGKFVRDCALNIGKDGVLELHNEELTKLCLPTSAISKTSAGTVRDSVIFGVAGFNRDSLNQTAIDNPSQLIITSMLLDPAGNIFIVAGSPIEKVLPTKFQEFLKTNSGNADLNNAVNSAAALKDAKITYTPGNDASTLAAATALADSQLSKGYMVDNKGMSTGQLRFTDKIAGEVLLDFRGSYPQKLQDKSDIGGFFSKARVYVDGDAPNDFTKSLLASPYTYLSDFQVIKTVGGQITGDVKDIIFNAPPFDESAFLADFKAATSKYQSSGASNVVPYDEMFEAFMGSQIIPVPAYNTLVGKTLLPGNKADTMDGIGILAKGVNLSALENCKNSAIIAVDAFIDAANRKSFENCYFVGKIEDFTKIETVGGTPGTKVYSLVYSNIGGNATNHANFIQPVAADTTKNNILDISVAENKYYKLSAGATSNDGKSHVFLTSGQAFKNVVLDISGLPGKVTVHAGKGVDSAPYAVVGKPEVTIASCATADCADEKAIVIDAIVIDAEASIIAAIFPNRTLAEINSIKAAYQDATKCTQQNGDIDLIATLKAAASATASKDKCFFVKGNVVVPSNYDKCLITIPAGVSIISKGNFNVPDKASVQIEGQPDRDPTNFLNEPAKSNVFAVANSNRADFSGYKVNDVANFVNPGAAEKSLIDFGKQVRGIPANDQTDPGKNWADPIIKQEVLAGTPLDRFKDNILDNTPNDRLALLADKDFCDNYDAVAKDPAKQSKFKETVDFANSVVSKIQTATGMNEVDSKNFFKAAVEHGASVSKGSAAIPATIPANFITIAKEITFPADIGLIDARANDIGIIATDKLSDYSSYAILGATSSLVINEQGQLQEAFIKGQVNPLTVKYNQVKSALTAPANSWWNQYVGSDAKLQPIRDIADDVAMRAVLQDKTKYADFIQFAKLLDTTNCGDTTKPQASSHFLKGHLGVTDFTACSNLIQPALTPDTQGKYFELPATTTAAYYKLAKDQANSFNKYVVFIPDALASGSVNVVLDASEINQSAPVGGKLPDLEVFVAGGTIPANVLIIGKSSVNNACSTSVANCADDKSDLKAREAMLASINDATAKNTVKDLLGRTTTNFATTDHLIPKTLNTEYLAVTYQNIKATDRCFVDAKAQQLLLLHIGDSSKVDLSTPAIVNVDSSKVFAGNFNPSTSTYAPITVANQRGQLGDGVQTVLNILADSNRYAPWFKKLLEQQIGVKVGEQELDTTKISSVAQDKLANNCANIFPAKDFSREADGYFTDKEVIVTQGINLEGINAGALASQSCSRATVIAPWTAWNQVTQIATGGSATKEACYSIPAGGVARLPDTTVAWGSGSPTTPPATLPAEKVILANGFKDMVYATDLSTYFNMDARASKLPTENTVSVVSVTEFKSSPTKAIYIDIATRDSSGNLQGLYKSIGDLPANQLLQSNFTGKAAFTHVIRLDDAYTAKGVLDVAGLFDANQLTDASNKIAQNIAAASSQSVSFNQQTAKVVVLVPESWVDSTNHAIKGEHMQALTVAGADVNFISCKDISKILIDDECSYKGANGAADLSGLIAAYAGDTFTDALTGATFNLI